VSFMIYEMHDVRPCNVQLLRCERSFNKITQYEGERQIMRLEMKSRRVLSHNEVLRQGVKFFSSVAMYRGVYILCEILEH